MIGERTATRSSGLVATGKATLEADASFWIHLETQQVQSAGFIWEPSRRLMLGGSQRVVELAGASGILFQVALAVLVKAEAPRETSLGLGQR